MVSYIYDNLIRDRTMTTTAIRINARLTGEDARRFAELTRGKDAPAVSDLLRDALREYYARHAKARPNALALMQASGFIGGFDASADLSSRYKDYLTESYANKLPQAVHEPPSPRYGAGKSRSARRGTKAMRK
jgi:hypothetical protein